MKVSSIMIFANVRSRKNFRTKLLHDSFYLILGFHEGKYLQIKSQGYLYLTNLIYDLFKKKFDVNVLSRLERVPIHCNFKRNRAIAKTSIPLKEHSFSQKTRIDSRLLTFITILPAIFTLASRIKRTLV